MTQMTYSTHGIYKSELKSLHVKVNVNIITYLDNDSMSKPNTQNAGVYTLETDGYTSKEQLIAHHPRVFEEGVGMFKGDYSIYLSTEAVPTQHSPQRVPVAL